MANVDIILIGMVLAFSIILFGILMIFIDLSITLLCLILGSLILLFVPILSIKYDNSSNQGKVIFLALLGILYFIIIGAIVYLSFIFSNWPALFASAILLLLGIYRIIQALNNID